MRTVLRALFRGLVTSLLVVLAGTPAVFAASDRPGNLVDGSWLQKNLGRADLLILDASPAQTYAAQHIPGAVNVDVFSYGAQETDLSGMQQRFRSWGISPGKTIVLYDAGGTYFATRLFFTLAYHGYPVRNLAVLDGGFAKWQAAGLPVSKEATLPATGSFTIGPLDEDLRVRLPEVLTASGDRSGYALVDALGADWHYGQVAPFDKAGHIPYSVLLPAAEFFNADKTFKSPEEIRKMLGYQGVHRGQAVYSYCGGGIAASVPFFAIRYLAGYPKVELFVESELGWLKDPRELPYWTYDAPYLMRRAEWLRAWNGKMLRMYGVSGVSLVDIRPKEAFDEGHLPYSLNIPASVFASHVGTPAQFAAILAAAGVDPSHEAVIISGAGVTSEAALAFALLEKVGQRKVSVFVDSFESAAKHGLALTREPTVVGEKKAPGEITIVPVAYPANLRDGVIVGDSGAARGPYPKVFIASGSALPTKVPAGTVVHVPYGDLLEAAGVPKAAKDVWSVLSKAGVPRYAELVVIADDPGEAAAMYYILKLMGWPDVKVLTEKAQARG